MYILKLSLCGYKNTYEKSEVTLNRGLNVLLGENGCGKTAIINALRMLFREMDSRYSFSSDDFYCSMDKGSASSKIEISAELTALSENEKIAFLSWCDSDFEGHLQLQISENLLKPGTSNMTGKTYSSWMSENKKQIVAILNTHLETILGTELDKSATFMRAALKTGSEAIGLMNQINPTELKVETIHAVKGRTFDAVLLMSSADARGKTGYWENWLTPDDEAARIAYVACSRPRILLGWGVHTLTDNQRKKLEHLGFEQYNSSIQAQED